jgi:hypothetical protein
MTSDKKRGGDRGPASGTTIRNVTLSEPAARELRRRATITTTRYRKEDADEAASDILEHLAAGRLLLLSDDIRAALPWLETARSQCFHEDAARGLDQLIAAILSALPHAPPSTARQTGSLALASDSQAC